MDPSKPILVAIDFSPCSAAAFRQAAHIARWRGTPLVALHVVDLPIILAPDTIVPTGLPLGWALPALCGDDLIANARERWEAFIAQCGGDQGAKVIFEIGNPRDEILQAVRRLRPSLLLVGAHSAHDSRRGIGTTASACAQYAAAQVMVVQKDQTTPFRRLVACADFSGASRVALDEAIAVASEDQATLHILHVYHDPWRITGPPKELTQNMPEFAAQYRRAVEARLRTFCEPLSHELAALKAEFAVVQSDRHADGIIAFATRHGCDLVVLGTRARANIRDFIWGSTAERVVREAPCAVLAVKPPGFIAPATDQPSAAVPRPTPAAV